MKKEEKPTTEEFGEEEVDIEVDDTSGDMVARLAKLRTELAACKKERQEYLDGWQRAKADLINAKKIAAGEREEHIRQAGASVLSAIIPVLDSFDMAVSDRESWEKVEKTWRDGMERIHTQLLKVLEAHGVEEINPEVGEQFDPELHEPLSTTPANETHATEQIVQIFQKGYRLNGKVLRPAKVVIAVE